MPYFSIIDTPIAIIVVILCALASSCISAVGYIGCVDIDIQPTKSNILLSGFCGALFFVLLLWVAIGDSVGGSAHISAWLKSTI